MGSFGIKKKINLSFYHYNIIKNYKYGIVHLVYLFNLEQYNKTTIYSEFVENMIHVSFFFTGAKNAFSLELKLVQSKKDIENPSNDLQCKEL